jgi:hypothetical protein
VRAEFVWSAGAADCAVGVDRVRLWHKCNRRDIAFETPLACPQTGARRFRFAFRNPFRPQLAEVQPHAGVTVTLLSRRDGGVVLHRDRSDPGDRRNSCTTLRSCTRGRSCLGA